MKVTVLPSSFSGEEIVQQALAAASAALPNGKEPNGATVIRDAAGKVVKVEVNLPIDTSANDHANAVAKINENPGVSKAQGFPFTGSETFEGYANGAALTAPFAGKGTSFGDTDSVVAMNTSPITGSISIGDPDGLQGGNFNLSVNNSALGLVPGENGTRMADFSLNVKKTAGSISVIIGGSATFTGTVGQNWKANGNDTGIPFVSNQVYNLKVWAVQYGPMMFYIDSALAYTLPDSGSAGLGGLTCSIQGNGSSDWRVDDLAYTVYDGDLL